MLSTSLALAMLTHVSHANKALELNWIECERERQRERVWEREREWQSEWVTESERSRWWNKESLMSGGGKKVGSHRCFSSVDKLDTKGNVSCFQAWLIKDVSEDLWLHSLRSGSISQGFAERWQPPSLNNKLSAETDRTILVPERRKYVSLLHEVCLADMTCLRLRLLTKPHYKAVIHKVKCSMKKPDPSTGGASSSAPLVVNRTGHRCRTCCSGRSSRHSSTHLILTDWGPPFCRGVMGDSVVFGRWWTAVEWTQTPEGQWLQNNAKYQSASVGVYVCSMYVSNVCMYVCVVCMSLCV